MFFKNVRLNNEALILITITDTAPTFVFLNPSEKYPAKWAHYDNIEWLYFSPE